MSTLPHPRILITALIDTLSRETAACLAERPDQRRKKSTTAGDTDENDNKYNNNNNNNPLCIGASPNAKALLLTLHALYPTVVLPALDLLDRGLVVRLVLKGGDDVVVAAGQDVEKEKKENEREEKEGEEEEDVKEKRRRRRSEEASNSGDVGAQLREDVHVGTVDRKSGCGRYATTTTTTTAAATTTTATESSKPKEKLLLPSKNDITVYYVRSTAAIATEMSQKQRRTAPSDDADGISGGASTSNDAPMATTTFHEVRTQAWNCTCPDFMFAAFPVRKPIATDPGDPTGASDSSGGGHDDDDDDADDDENYHAQNKEGAEDESASEENKHKYHHADWSFGGGSRRNTRDCVHDAHAARTTETPVCKHLLACVLAQRCGVFADMVHERTVSRAEMAAWAAGMGPGPGPGNVFLRF